MEAVQSFWLCTDVFIRIALICIVGCILDPVPLLWRDARRAVWIKQRGLDLDRRYVLDLSPLSRRHGGLQSSNIKRSATNHGLAIFN